MQPVLAEALSYSLQGDSVPADLSHKAIGAIMDGECEPLEIAAFLSSIATKGETVDELTGAARAMRERATNLILNNPGELLDTCGTGGDRMHTFNISTAVAITAAAVGIPVAKHGNRSVSSSSGSADVLEKLGVRIDLSVEQTQQCIEEIGIGFCFAPLYHGAMKHAAPVRKQLGFRTLFNLLGPLCNPAQAGYQVLGAANDDHARMIAQVLMRLNAADDNRDASTKKQIVVCGNHQLDEVCLWGETLACLVVGDESHELKLSPTDFGLPTCLPEEISVRSSEQSADVLLSVFENKDGPARNMVVANTATALFVAGHAKELRQGVSIVEAALAEGRVQEKLDQLREFTNTVNAAS